MPYIPKRDRKRAAQKPETSGELNFAVTKLVLDYLREFPESYASYNSAIGVLESAKLELYRRAVALYENKAIKKNGDVYR